MDERSRADGLRCLGLACVLILVAAVRSGAAEGHGTLPSRGPMGRGERVVLCLGDSITAGEYPTFLQDLLDEAKVRARVYNCGMPGYTSGAYLEFLRSFGLFRAVRPDFVLLQLGTNDARTDFAHTETTKFRRNMTEIVRLLREELYPGRPPQVLISTVPPILPGPAVFTEESARRIAREINPAVRDIAEKLGLGLVDNYRLFEPHPDWLADGVHPTEEGYRAMAKNWFDALSGAMSKHSGSDPGTGLVYDERYLLHETGPGHPERPERLTAILAGLEKAGMLERLVRLEPSPAATEWITLVHTGKYVERVRRACEEGVGYLDSPDTPVSEKSYEVARLAVGGVLGAVDAVMAGRARNAFCAVRPPGHHALSDRAMGFCLFNNVAIGARYVQKKYKVSRVLIVDWDVHHGNGTQDAFYDDPTVMYFSVHRYPFYPGTGGKDETGRGEGRGYTINVPLPAGSGDEEYVRALEENLKPRALEFRPEFVFVSAGFDAHGDDPLGGMRVTAAGFERMSEVVKGIAEECCDGRLVSVLEGGYDLDALAECVAAHLAVLSR